MNVLLINDNSAHLNWGAQATPPALRAILNKALAGSSISVRSNAWLKRSYRRMKPPLGGTFFRTDVRTIFKPFLNRASVPTSFYPRVADDFDYWAEAFMAGRGGPQAREFLASAGEADVVVYNGENSIYRNTEEGCRGVFLLWFAKKYLKKPACIVNHTAHLDDVKPILSSMVKLAYPELDLVAVREPCSLENLRALGIPNAELYPDVVFALRPDDYPRKGFENWRARSGLGDQPYFCISGSGLPMSAPKGSWEGGVAALARRLKKLGCQAVLVAKDPWCEFFRDVAKRTDSVYFGPEHHFSELWPLFENAQFLVTGHYHYVIFASMVGCPFVPLSVNNHKMRGVCRHLGWHRTEPFDATSLLTCGAQIEEEARRLSAERPRMIAFLLEKSLRLATEAWKLGPRVAGLVRGRIREGSPAGGDGS